MRRCHALFANACAPRTRPSSVEKISFMWIGVSAGKVAGVTAGVQVDLSYARNPERASPSRSRRLMAASCRTPPPDGGGPATPRKRIGRVAVEIDAAAMRPCRFAGPASGTSWPSASHDVSHLDHVATAQMCGSLVRMRRRRERRPVLRSPARRTDQGGVRRTPIARITTSLRSPRRRGRRTISPPSRAHRNPATPSPKRSCTPCARRCSATSTAISGSSGGST